MATTISFVAEPSFSKAIEELVERTGLYQSKSEFVRDAAREKLLRVLSLEKHLVEARRLRKRLQKKASFKGELTAKERDALAKSYLKSLEE